MVIDMRTDGVPALTGDVVFYNPNHLRMKLTEINIEVFVDGKKSAQADQKLNSIVPAKAEFSVPLEIKLSLKELGLLDTVLSLLGGKKYEILCLGYIRVKVHGVTIKVPVNYKDEIRLKI
jgi:LEA14-like dessication related protein